MKLKTKTKILINILVVSCLGVSLTHARGPGGGRPSNGIPGFGFINEAVEDVEPPLPPIMEALDRDLNGKISAAELSAAVNSLTKLDTNGDGALSEKEYKLAAEGEDEKRGRKTRHVPPLIKVLDSDADGEISAEEIANAEKSLAFLDANNDGSLSKMETRPGRRIKTRR